MKILIIEPDMEFQDTLEQWILTIDPEHEVTCVYSSSEAIRRMEKTKYDIIICEIFMKGGIPGNELMQIARGNPFKIGMAEILEGPDIRQPFNIFLMKPFYFQSV